jgi:serine/threonine protein kinase
MDCSRRALRLLIKLVAAGGPLPDSVLATEMHLEHGRDASFFGGFSDVFKARNKAGRFVALKRIRITSTHVQKLDLIQVRTSEYPIKLASIPLTARQRLHKEALVWTQLRHRSILPFLGIDKSTFPEHPCLVSPWMDGGTLLNFVQQKQLLGIARLSLVSFLTVSLDIN